MTKRLAPHAIEPSANDGYVLTTLAGKAAWAAGGGGGGGGAGELLGYKSHNPSTMSAYTTSSTALVDIDATNLAVTFTAPAGGAVLVRVGALCRVNATAVVMFWALREGTTQVAGAQAQAINGAAGLRATSVEWVVTGLIPGNVYTYKWAWRVSSSTGNMYAGGQGDNNYAGPASMTVWSLG